MRELSPSKYKKVSRGKTLTKSARNWITQESIVCSIFIMDKRTDVSGIITVPVLMSSLHVAKNRLRSN